MGTQKGVCMGSKSPTACSAEPGMKGGTNSACHLARSFRASCWEGARKQPRWEAGRGGMLGDADSTALCSALGRAQLTLHACKMIMNGREAPRPGWVAFDELWAAGVAA